MQYLENTRPAQNGIGSFLGGSTLTEPEEASTIDNIAAARSILLKKLPMELVDNIIDEMQYWPSSSTEMVNKKMVWQRNIYGSFPGSNGNSIICRSNPIGFTRRDTNGEYWSDIPIPSPPGENETLRDPESFRDILGNDLPTLKRPVRKIIFTIISHDQGWTSNETTPDQPYGNSWTWFDVGIERFSNSEVCEEKRETGSCRHDELETSFGEKLTACSVRTVLPGTRPVKDANGNETGKVELDIFGSPNDEWTVQKNKTANDKDQEYVIIWSWTDDIKPGSPEAVKTLTEQGRGMATGMGKFVRSLQVGDIITLWAKARFPGWQNKVKKAKIDVYWTM